MTQVRGSMTVYHWQNMMPHFWDIELSLHWYNFQNKIDVNLKFYGKKIQLIGQKNSRGQLIFREWLSSSSLIFQSSRMIKQKTSISSGILFICIPETFLSLFLKFFSVVICCIKIIRILFQLHKMRSWQRETRMSSTRDHFIGVELNWLEFRF